MPPKRESQSSNNIAMPVKRLAVSHTHTDNTISSSGGETATTSAADLATEQRQQQFVANANLCRLVRRCPWMYDRHHVNYAKKWVLDESWTKIAFECNDSVASCKERWRNIRAAFARSINIYKTHGGPNRVKPYYLHKELDFLVKPMMEGRDKVRYDDLIDGVGDIDIKEGNDLDDPMQEASTGAATSLEDEDEAGEPTSQEHPLPEDQSARSDSQTHLQDDQPNVAETHSAKDTRRKHTIYSNGCWPADAAPSRSTSALPKMMRLQHQHVINPCPSSDADAQFLQALLPDMRVMNARQKIIFKRKVYQSVEDVLEINTNFPAPQQQEHAQNVTLSAASSALAQVLMQRVAHSSDVELQRILTALHTSAMPTADSSTTMANGGSSARQTLSIIPCCSTQMPKSRNRGNTTTATMPPLVEAPWDQLVPISIKTEPDDIKNE